MKLFPLHKNTLALCFASVLVIGFFVSGLLDILDYFIVKVLLFSGFVALAIVAINYGVENEIKKKRLEEKLQDESH
jgi:hypothetical protein